ncbi:MAG TPA: hypothetical protein VL947_06185, partial [Cytophagales bacterium]|nr:hypothetical protein [Cytophagales bacterium]
MKRSLLLILFCFAFLASKAQTTITNTTVIPESCKGAKDGKATVNVSFPTGIYDTIGYTKLIPPMTIEVVYHKITNIQATDNVTFEGLYGNQSSISVYGIKNGNVVSGSISSIGVVVGSGYDVQEPQVGVGALNQNIGLCEGQPLRLFSQSESGAGYKWRGPNAFTSTDQNPVIVNPQAANMGIYKVVASHIGNQGITCYSDTVSITPNIVDVPNPEFTIPSGVCQNEPLTLVVDSPTSGVDAYAWKIPNGTPNSNNTQGPFNVTYSSVTGATPNIITLTVTKSGCMDSVKHSLHVRPKPTGSISSIQ